MDECDENGDFRQIKLSCIYIYIGREYQNNMDMFLGEWM